MNMLQNLHLQAAFALEVNTRRLRIYSISPPSTPPQSQTSTFKGRLYTEESAHNRSGIETAYLIGVISLKNI